MESNAKELWRDEIVSVDRILFVTCYRTLVKCPPWFLLLKLTKRTCQMLVPIIKIESEMNNLLIRSGLKKQAPLNWSQIRHNVFWLAAQERDRWWSSSVIRQAVPDHRCGTTKCPPSNLCARNTWFAYHWPAILTYVERSGWWFSIWRIARIQELVGRRGDLAFYATLVMKPVLLS